MEPVSAVPEPGSVILCGLGALAAAWSGRRRRGPTPTA
ncbi:MAG: PEP-CTERM sorting domain-containing protein [Planctomycetaceae bacterium]